MYRCFIILLALVLATNASVAREKHRSKPQHEIIRLRAARWPREESRLSRSRARSWTQWIGEQGALDAAKKDWMERVRYYHGETFLDLSHAADFAKRCGRVSIGEVAGQVLYRCEIEARPCKGSFKSLDGGK